LEKIPENPGKNFCKILENLGKLPEITHKNCDFLQNHTTFAESYEDLFWRSSQNKVFMRKYLQKKWSKMFSSKFGEIWANILRTPKSQKLLPAPTPMTQTFDEESI